VGVHDSLAHARVGRLGWGPKAEKVAAKYRVSRARVHRLVQRRREVGDFGPRPQRKFRGLALGDQEDRLRLLVTAQPDRWSSRSATVRRRRGRRERSRTCSWCLRARISRCSAARERTSERSDMSTDTTMGIIVQRLLYGMEKPQ